MVKRDSDNAELQSYQYSPTSGRLMNYDYLSGEFILYANSGGTTLSEYHEYTANNPTWTKSYVYFGDGLLSTVTPNGSGGETTDFNHPDRLGTRTITNQAAGTSSEQATLPFGTALNAESTNTTNKNRFTSYDRSTRTGLDYAVNRSYDSKQGRFTQVDPIGMGASSLFAPQTLNLYTYCGNDPINHTDPSGLFWGSFFKWLGKALKWIALAVTIAVAVLSVAVSYGGTTGILASVLGKLLGVLAKIGSVIHFASGGLIAAEGSQALAAIGLQGVRILGGVGAIANNFARNEKRKQDYEGIIRQTVADTLERLRHNEKCLKTIQGSSSENPILVLETVGPTYNPYLTAVAAAPGGRGSKGFIQVGDRFFKRSVGGRAKDFGLNSLRSCLKTHLGHNLRSIKRSIAI